MARVEVQLPALLSAVLDGCQTLDIQSETLAEALTTIRIDHPKLAVHVFDETGAIREHVLCFHNDINTRWLDSASVTLNEGDTLRFYQAVSGG